MHSHPFEGHVRHLVVDVGDGVVVAEVLRHPQRDVEHPLGVIEVALVPRQDPLLYDADQLLLSVLRPLVFFTALILTIFVEDGSEPAETDAKQDIDAAVKIVARYIGLDEKSVKLEFTNQHGYTYRVTMKVFLFF